MSKLPLEEILCISTHDDTGYTTVITYIPKDEFLQLCKEQNFTVIEDQVSCIARNSSGALVAENFIPLHDTVHQFCTVFYSK